MSTKFFKNRSKPKEVAPVPRELSEIQKEYSELRARAGELTYQVFVLEGDLQQVNQALLTINHEAAARQKLDKEASVQQPQQEEVK